MLVIAKSAMEMAVRPKYHPRNRFKMWVVLDVPPHNPKAEVQPKPVRVYGPETLFACNDYIVKQGKGSYATNR